MSRSSIAPEKTLDRDIAVLLAIGKTFADRWQTIQHALKNESVDRSFEDLLDLTRASAIKGLMPSEAKREWFLAEAKTLWDDAIRLSLRVNQLVNNDSD